MTKYSLRSKLAKIIYNFINVLGAYESIHANYTVSIGDRYQNSVKILLRMRKVASCTSYSEFRRKSMSNVEGNRTDSGALVELDAISKQLDALGVSKKKIGI